MLIILLGCVMCVCVVGLYFCCSFIIEYTSIECVCVDCVHIKGKQLMSL